MKTAVIFTTCTDEAFRLVVLFKHFGIAAKAVNTVSNALGALLDPTTAVLVVSDGADGDAAPHNAISALRSLPSVPQVPVIRIWHRLRVVTEDERAQDEQTIIAPATDRSLEAALKGIGILGLTLD